MRDDYCLSNYSYGTEVEVVTTQEPPADLSAPALKTIDQFIQSDGFFCGY